MTAAINPLDLDTALKTLWGASQLPFGALVEKPYASATFKETRRRLEQWVAVRACGLLHGPNGVGKTLLMHRSSTSASQRNFVGPSRTGKHRLPRLSKSSAFSVIGREFLWPMTCRRRLGLLL